MPITGVYAEVISSAVESFAINKDRTDPIGPHSPYLHIHSDTALKTLNTSIWGGGFGYHRHLVNRQVSKSYNCEDPQTEMGQFLQGCGIPPADACGMLTAAYVQDGACREEHYSWVDEDGLEASLLISAWATAGLGNSSRAGLAKPVDRLFPGTINIIVLVDGKLTDAAMAGAIITATEAKAAALQDLRVKARGTALIATGTTTDAVLMAATQRGTREYAYAGSATVLGYLVGRIVYNTVSEASSRYLSRYPDLIL